MDFQNRASYDALTEKWEPLLNHGDRPEITDSYKKKVTAQLLENQERSLREQFLTEAPTNSMLGGGFQVSQGAGSANSALAGYDPILISLVRRSMPNLMAYDIAGVQPMSAPTGLIFAMRSRYAAQSSTNNAAIGGGRGQEALFQEAFAKFGGSGGTAAGAAFSATGGINPIGVSAANGLHGFSGGTFGANTGLVGIRDTNANFDLQSFRGMLTSRAESLGESGNTFSEMAFSIERLAVEAKTRALKAEYSTELAQDLKAVHGLDAESELANILSTEILHEINRELMYTLYRTAKSGAQQTDLTTAGVYNLAGDSDGRWSAERFRGLMYQIEREANTIAKETRRGKGNFVICSSDVASALAMGGFLNLTPAVQTQLEVDDTGNTFAGILNGKFKVYIDPYAALGVDFALVGYRGASPYDAGVFYCPYVPLQMVRAVDPSTFQPKIGFKTRYGMVANPFAENTDINALAGNQYYRILRVLNIHGNGS
jgi:hypothetical protein